MLPARGCQHGAIVTLDAASKRPPDARQVWSIDADVVQDTGCIKFFGRFDQPGAHKRFERLIGHGIEAECVEGAGQRLPQQFTGVSAHYRLPAGTDLRFRLQAQVQGLLTSVDLALATAINAASSLSVCADPMCSKIFRWPRIFSTICTAVAPDDVFTFRTNGLTPTTYSPSSAPNL